MPETINIFLDLKIKFAKAVRYFLLVIFLLLACEHGNLRLEEEALNGAWLGGAYQLDDGYFRPFSGFFEIDSSKITRHTSATMMHSIQDITIGEDSIFFPFKKYERSAVRRRGLKLILGKYNPLIYKKIDPNVIDFSSFQMTEGSLMGQWESERNYLSFSEDELLIFDKKTMKKSRFCWNVQSLDELQFLQRQGSFAECDYPFFALQLIQKLSADLLILEGWTLDDFHTETYKKSFKDLSEYTYPDFQLCNPSLYKNNNADWYYFKYPSFEGGLYRLKQVFDQLFKSVDLGNINGLVRVEFVINCAGDIGRFRVEEMDYNYTKTSLNPSISSQVINILKHAGRWIPGERRDQKVDTYKFLIFKIKNGRVDEIYP